TCTVVDRDKASEGLLASGDERMEKLIEFRETLLYYRDPANGKRGPTPKFQKQLDRISRLPRTKQRGVMEMLDEALAQASR
ncbi:MAG: hypothetical protein ACREUA_06825, partial [Burkholderiales bacterium]